MLPVAAAASAWGLVLDRLEGESEATMVLLLSAVALGATGWYVGAYYEGTQTDPEFIDAVRSSRLLQLALAVVLVVISAVAGLLNGPAVAVLTISASPVLLGMFGGRPLAANEAVRRRSAARSVAVKAGGLALVAMIVEGTLTPGGRDTLISGGALGLAAFAVGFGAALFAATLRLASSAVRK